MTSVTNDSIELDHAGEAGWQRIDRALRTIARRRGALDAKEAEWLREALRVKIWREVGCVSMADYVERRLGYAPRTAHDRVRVAMALETLPKLAGALASGLPHSAVRELTRVATPETEQRWLEAIRGKSVHDIEGMVAGRSKGANPDDPPHPSLVGRTLPFEGVRPATEALLRDARRKAQEERGGGEVLSDDELLATLARAFLEGGAGERTSAPYQVAVTLCEHCGRGWQDSGGRTYELSKADLERACCDAQHLGSLDADHPERAWQDVPPSVRRLIHRRDGGRCKVPGCRSTRCLEIHHIVPRIDGGAHDAENLILLCDSCHAAHHRGLVAITGTASELVVTRRHHVAYDQGDSEPGSEAIGGDAILVTEAPEVEPSAHVGTKGVRPPAADHVEAMAFEPSAHVGTNELRPAETAPDRVEDVASSRASAYERTASAERGTSRDDPKTRLACERLRVEARSALVGLGYQRAVAGKAVDLALQRLGSVSLEELLRKALRCCHRR